MKASVFHAAIAALADQRVAVDVPGLRKRTLFVSHRLLVYGLLLAGTVLFILPFMWMVSTSLKPEQEVFAYPPQFLPTHFEWQQLSSTAGRYCRSIRF